MVNLNTLKSAYLASPQWLKSIYGRVPASIRFGGEYRKWRKLLEQQLDYEEFNIIKLKETLAYSLNHVPYYKNLAYKTGFTLEDFNELNDLTRFPLLDKNIVKQNFDDLIASGYPKNKMFLVTTGGSSGEPMSYWQSTNVWKKEWAFGFNFFSKYGYKPSDLKASFRGGDFQNVSEYVFWKINPAHNEIHFSPFHLNELTVDKYILKLNELKPKVFHSYPSSLILLVQLMIKRNLRLNYKVKLIIIISENYSDSDVKTIESFFGCKVISFYGHSERLIFAPAIDTNLAKFSIDPRYGLCELIDSKGQSVIKSGVDGELVGTSFDNYAMPLIRFKTEDTSSYLDYGSKELSKIRGRWQQEYLDGLHGTKIFLSALNLHSDALKNVIQHQYVQIESGKVELHLIVNNSFSENDENEILRELHNKVNGSILFSVILVTSMKLTKRGKVRRIIKCQK